MGQVGRSESAWPSPERTERSSFSRSRPVWRGSRCGRYASQGDEPLRRGTKALLTAVPRVASAALRIEVLAPMRILVDGVAVERPELRRARVRELLTKLVVRERVTRDQAMLALWPDADADSAGRNLRVTLSRLRQLLEPDRSPGDATYFLRIDGGTLRLARVPALEVDLWELERTNPARVLTMWRGEPLPDLDRLTDFSPQVEGVRLQLFDAAMRLGELHITEWTRPRSEPMRRAGAAH